LSFKHILLFVPVKTNDIFQGTLPPQKNTTIMTTFSIRRFTSIVCSICYAITAIAIGLGVRYLHQHVIWIHDKNDKNQNPIVTACTSVEFDSMTTFCQQTGMVPYAQNLGLVLFNPWVCIVTQQLYNYVVDTQQQQQQQYFPMVRMLFVNKVGLQFLITVMTVTEAGRQHNRSILLYPTVMEIGYYLFGSGMSVVFPILWVSSYCLWGYGNPFHFYQQAQDVDGSSNTEIGVVGIGGDGMVNLSRARLGLGIWVGLPRVVLSVLAFKLDPNHSKLWKFCTGLLGSPLLALLPLVGWTLQPSPPHPMTSQATAVQSAKAVATGYGIVGGICFLGWIYTTYLLITHYYYYNNIGDGGGDGDGDGGSNLWQLFWNNAWAKWNSAEPSHQSLFVDVVALWLALILHISYRNIWSALEALLLLPFFGPGAACAMELATLEVERFSVPIEPQPQRTKSKQE